MNLTKKFAAIAVLVVAGAMLAPAPAMATTVSAPIAHSSVKTACRVVTVGPTLPWWSCINFLPGTLLPSGCYSHKVTVC